MKKEWIEPEIMVQQFVANEYVAACWKINCNVPLGYGYIDNNGNSKYDSGDTLLTPAGKEENQSRYKDAVFIIPVYKGFRMMVQLPILCGILVEEKAIMRFIIGVMEMALMISISQKLVMHNGRPTLMLRNSGSL